MLSLVNALIFLVNLDLLHLFFAKFIFKIPGNFQNKFLLYMLTRSY